VASAGDRRGAYRILVGKPERTKTVVIRSPKRKDNIKKDFHVLG